MEARLAAANVLAQRKPDFSGRWPSEPETKAPAQQCTGELDSSLRATLTLTQAAPRLTVEYMFFACGDMQPPLKFVYALNGSETKNSVMTGRGIQMQTSVITTTHSYENLANGQPLKIKVKQRLKPASPTMLVVEITRSGVLGDPAATTRTIYRKN